MLKIDYFNPVVDNLTLNDLMEEERQRALCDYVLYVITPKMTGVYPIAEVVDDSNKRPERTLFCVLLQDGRLEFIHSQLMSLRAVARMVQRNGAHVFDSLEDIAVGLNKAVVGEGIQLKFTGRCIKTRRVLRPDDEYPNVAVLSGSDPNSTDDAATDEYIKWGRKCYR